ncbi:hypothetical protein [Ammoniphilus sp. 3BR4]|uniref:hypothetical protein n=1 Tax=Ammoniphilus sp. 3BR4 TaxID=3158265 RepID=UPI003467ED29
MLLSKVLDLNNSLSKNRLKMLDLAKLKGMSDPEVIQVGEKLEQVRENLQKIITYEQPSRGYSISWSPWKGGEENSQGL